MNNKKAYFVLMVLLLTCIQIKYGVSKTDPFQQSTLLLFLISMFSHVLAFTADMTKPITRVTFHVSGITACETLLWTLSAQLLWCSIINFLLLLLAIFLFFHPLTHLIISFINYIIHHFHSTPPNALQMPNIELQPQVTEAVSFVNHHSPATSLSIRPPPLELAASSCCVTKPFPYLFPPPAPSPSSTRQLQHSVSPPFSLVSRSEPSEEKV